MVIPFEKHQSARASNAYQNHRIVASHTSSHKAYQKVVVQNLKSDSSSIHYPPQL